MDLRGQSLENIRFDDPALQLIYETILRRDFHFLKGYLTEDARSRLKTSTEIILYGAGKIGHEVLRLFEEYGIRNYRLAVTKKDDDATGLMGMAVELHTLQSLRETALVVISAGKTARPQMLAEAQRMGFRQIVGYDEIM